MADPTGTKKRKHNENGQTVDGASPKRAKKSKEQKQKRVEKGKGRDSASNEDNAFRVVSASVVLSVPPLFSKDLMKGVHEMLDSLIMRYVPALRGVVLSHSNAAFLSKTASIKAECPFAVCTVGFDATVWSPQVGSKLTGKIRLCSPDHIALLVLQTFNVSIPRHHIETEDWEFQYGPAENDPEFGPSAATKEEDTNDDAMVVDDSRPGEDEEAETEVGGSWLHKLTGEKLGGTDGMLSFTVIGLKIANQMLSLVGSLQDDPFSERHNPQAALPINDAQSSEVGNLDRDPSPLGPLEESSDEEQLPAEPKNSNEVQHRPESIEDKKRQKEEERRARELRNKEKAARRAAKEQKRKEKEERKKEKKSAKSKDKASGAAKHEKKLKDEGYKEPLIAGKGES